MSDLQIYELYNGGALPVQYEFDLMSLKIIQQVLLLFSLIWRTFVFYLYALTYVT